MILPILKDEDPFLRKVAQPITKDYPNLGELISNMFETMSNAGGIGLAAPQVGVSIRLFVIGKNSVFINPEIIERSDAIISIMEGCLSITGTKGNVPRNKIIKVKYFDENFEEHITDFVDYMAIVFQHEYDHLDGILFTDKISK
jgi:peptide deformylase